MIGQRITVSAVAVTLAVGGVLALEGVGDPLLAKVLALVVAIVAVMVYGAVTGHDRRLSYLSDPFSLMSVFFAQFYVVGSISMYFTGGLKSPFLYAFARERMVDALMGFLLLMVTIVIGYRLRLGGIIAGVIPEFAPTRRKPSGRWIETVIITAGMIGCLGWVSFRGGLLTTLSTGYGQMYPQGGAMFAIAFYALLTGILLMSWRVFTAPKGNWTRWIPLIGVLSFHFVFFGIITGVRKFLLFAFFGLLAVWLLSRGKDALPKLRVAVLMVLLLGFFSVWGALRSRSVLSLAGLEGEPSVAKQTPRFHEGYLGSVHGPFTMACMVFDLFPEQEPYRYGQTVHVALVGFIPRALWPGKPIGFGSEVTRYVMGPFSTVTGGRDAGSFAVTLLGDFYINFGWPGIIAGGLLLGVLCRVVTIYATTGMRGDGIQTQAARVLIPAVFIMGLGEVRADMATALMAYGLTLVPMVLALTFFRFDAASPVDIPVVGQLSSKKS